MLNQVLHFISWSCSISGDRTRKGIHSEGKLIIWILQPGSQKRSVDSDKTGGSKGNLDSIVVGIGHAAKDLVRSHKDCLEFRELSVFGEVGGRYLDKISNFVLRRGMTAFVGLLHYSNTTADELGLDRILKSVGYYVRTEGDSRNDDSFFELGSKTNAESMRGGVPRSINTSIDSYLNRGESSQPVQSLS